MPRWTIALRAARMASSFWAARPWWSRSRRPRPASLAPFTTGAPAVILTGVGGRVLRVVLGRPASASQIRFRFRFRGEGSGVNLCCGSCYSPVDLSERDTISDYVLPCGAAGGDMRAFGSRHAADSPRRNA
jgi:hypothetical protein